MVQPQNMKQKELNNAIASWTLMSCILTESYALYRGSEDLRIKLVPITIVNKVEFFNTNLLNTSVEEKRQTNCTGGPFLKQVQPSYKHFSV